jgi:hypothetical protein
MAARSTSVGLIHALKGRDWLRAEADLAQALRVARDIAYPTLTWQAAHQLGSAGFMLEVAVRWPSPKLIERSGYRARR